MKDRYGQKLSPGDIVRVRGRYNNCYGVVVEESQSYWDSSRRIGIRLMSGAYTLKTRRRVIAVIDEGF